MDTISTANKNASQTNTAPSQIQLFDFPAYDMNSFPATIPYSPFWEDFQLKDLIGTNSQTDNEGSFFMQLAQEMPATVAFGCASNRSSPDRAPVPSFLDARNNPEPQQGQAIRLKEFFAEAWPDQRRKRDWRGSEAGLFNKRTSEARRASLPLMGTISPFLSSGTSTNATIWESENLCHVKPLSSNHYGEIVIHFKKLNNTSSHNNQFVEGNFPSLNACNALMQLFFEYFNQMFPIIHQPSFDPDQEPWLLVLSIIAIGSHFSQQPIAIDCADILQEFVHRALQMTVCPTAKLHDHQAYMSRSQRTMTLLASHGLQYVPC